MNDEERKSVFFDPRGRRGAVAGRIGAALGLVVAVLSTLTIAVALVTIPTLPSFKGKHVARSLKEPPVDVRASGFRSLAAKERLLGELTKEAKGRKKKPSSQHVVVGFYASWEQSGLNSLRAHAADMTHLAPAWLTLAADGQSLETSDYDLDLNPTNQEVVDIARQNHLAIVPVLSNSVQSDNVDDQWDPKRVHTLLSSDQAMANLASKLRSWLEENGYQGINVDFENLEDSDYALLPRFLGQLKAAFLGTGLLVTTDIEADNSDPVEIADNVDWMVLMLYDEHDQGGKAGPIASIPWTQQCLDRVLKDVPEDKVVAGFGTYSYDWVKGQDHAESASFQEVMTEAQGYRADPPSEVVRYDPESMNDTFEYDGDNDVRHVVWMLDGVSAYNQWVIAQDAGVHGAALWVLGTEDPSVWSFLNNKKVDKAPDPADLGAVRFPFEVSYVGQGEIISVRSQPSLGSRDVKVDPDTGLVTAAVYQSYAHPFVVQKSGYKPGLLALTFDDGPDPAWTPKILDALRDLKAPATFFVVGSNAEHDPGIVERMYAEGHEIGSHTFLHPNLGYVSDERARLELNLTQMAIEGLTGHSTALFRPPYNADSQPETPDQLRPVQIADRLGYVTIGENVDPLDWSLHVPTADGGSRRKTAKDIVDFVVKDLARRRATQDEGNVILLHDAGGDRSATVEAVKLLVPALRKMGYTFVPVSDLMDKSRDTVMPPVPFRDRLTYWLGRFVLTGFFGLLAVLGWTFAVAIVLGIARSILVTTLALAGRKDRPLPAGPPVEEVSVVIAAYNESAVIARTVESALRSGTVVREVVVVDDGSTDDTATVVSTTFKDDPRVRLLSKVNGGKADALNLGIASVLSDVIVCIDADTQLESGAVALLDKRFSDPRVAAVAGNVRVGNEVNVLTKWQSLEYTVSQNIDRRAYSLLNAITVVPGAIGAWRRSAVLEVGGFQTDTLAEDMDLTWRLRRAGYRLVNEPEAVAWTEAPESVRASFRQRFRWAFGTLQCLWKHRGAMFSNGWFGWLALPTLWLFQIVFQILGPLVDLSIVFAVIAAGITLAGGSGENASSAATEAVANLSVVGFMYALFFAVEFVAALVAFRMERRRSGLLWWLFLQRFAYRQLMYGVVFKAIGRAVQGRRQGWGKLERTGSVTVPQ